jgi:ribokinase
MPAGRDDTTTAAKRRLREGGWYVRYTEWPSGHQVVLHRRSDTAVHLVTRWWPTEAEAFEEALAMAAEHELRRVPPPAPGAAAGPPAAPRPADRRTRDLDLVVLGDAREDLVVRTARVPAAGEVVEGDLVAEEPGGKGVRQAIAAARLGARVALVARVGADPRGDEIVSRLRVEGVRTEHVRRDPDARTAVRLVHLDRRGRTSTASFSGRAVALPSLEDVRGAEELVERSSVLLCSLAVSPASVAEALRFARRYGTRVVLDADPGRRLPASLLHLVDVVIVPARSCRIITGASATTRRGALEAARWLLHRGAAAAVLRTSRTTLLLTRNDEIWVPNAHAEYTESAVAGDAFCSALAVASAEDAELARAARLASAAAALATPRQGQMLEMPTRAAVARFAGEAPVPEELILDGILPAGAPEQPRHGRQ